MKCKRINGSAEQMLDPAAGGWGQVPGEPLELSATPLANQPSEYIKASRDEREIGEVSHLLVQAAHNGTDIFFRLTWEDRFQDVRITDNDIFPDGCGILMPVNGGEPPIDEMGSRDDPVNAWFWRADYDDEPRNMVARGLGTTETLEKCPIRTKSFYGNGGWSVVFTRPLALPGLAESATQLAAGDTVRVGFAVWEGHNGERAGVKSFSKEWREMELES